MAKVNISSSNFKIPNEGKNLINNNNKENQDLSSNFEPNVPRDYFIKNNASQNKFIKETNLTMQPRLKDKNGIISKEILNRENDLDINMNENNDGNIKKSEKKLSSSIFLYKESKIFTKFRRIYKKLQIYIAIFLSFFSAILFSISIFDLTKKMKNKKNFFLLNSFIFLCEIFCAILNIIFHIIYYSFNIKSINLIFIIISSLIFVFSMIYVHTYIQQKVDLLKILFHVTYNFCMLLINLIYLFMIYFLTRQKFKDQQNIEDIMNFTIRNEKIEDNLPRSKKERKNKGIELVDEENQ